MVDVYARAVINGLKSFESIPEAFKERVKARLKELGYFDLADV